MKGFVLLVIAVVMFLCEYLWVDVIKFNKALTCSNQDTYLCAMYIPPYESPYCCEGKSQNTILLKGDFSTGMGNKLVYIDTFDLKYIGKTLRQNNFVNRQRHSFASMINKHSKELRICIHLFYRSGIHRRSWGS